MLIREYRHRKAISIVFYSSVALFTIYLVSKSPVTTAPARRRFSQVCPPGFDQINDTQYEWFKNNVVQRSPGVGRFPTTSLFKDEIVILTPMSNCEVHLKRYFQNLCSLNYPHHLISIVLAEDSSRDKTFETAQQMAAQLQPFFKRIDFVRLPNNTETRSGHPSRHAPKNQLSRRRALAQVRNRLLIHALGKVGPEVRWAMWFDADIRHIPRDLIKHLIFVNQPVVAPTCLVVHDDGTVHNFDLFLFRETKESRKFLRKLSPIEVMLEGAGIDIKRKYLYDIKDEGDVVPIDGVGGCALLVDADLHRSGFIFPPFAVDHHIEAEGFAKAVAQLGFKVVGLPFVSVFHDYKHMYTNE